MLSLLTANPEALGMLALLLCAALVTVAHSTVRRTRHAPACARAVARRRVDVRRPLPRVTDPDAAGRPRPRAPSTV